MSCANFVASRSTDTSPIPGCVQQVNSFVQQLATRQITYVPEESLVTVAFLGNDFLVPNATTEGYVNNTKHCIDQLISKTNATNILVATSNASELYPFSSSLTASAPIAIKFQESPFLMRQMLQQTKAKYPTTNMYDFDVANILRPIANHTSPYMPQVDPSFSTTACLHMATSERDAPLAKCANPGLTMFYDDYHPTTKVHRAIAAAAAHLVQ
ncbi:hypothetical protein DSO57_1031474 [Entomophthora muscae]|uniref:Uncharacterized protein n=1 Tax=Entomophthora muscae TaxID=34485 RepID=A0ACC2TMB4_9FUNG|nr:hypothetical protein DSO57_1031474 [Entomophthora muscae]